DVLIMSYVTSICLDVYFLGRPVISNCAQLPQTTLQKRKFDYLRESEVMGLVDAGMPIAWSIPELLMKVSDAIADPGAHRVIGRRVLENWDYPQQEYQQRFI